MPRIAIAGINETPDRRLWAGALALLIGLIGGLAPCGAGESLSSIVAPHQPKMVKIYGAGGVRGLEPYQSGFLISDQGHILTAWSYVLDTDYITATLDDGRKFEAKLVNADPRLELAVLKIDALDVPYFDLELSVPADSGSRVLALSNLFGVAAGNEAASVQHGMIAVKTRLDARRGTFETPYHGPVYVLDAMTNNPGAAGGALLNQQGELLAMLGKELRSAQNNIWLNYAIPIEELQESVKRILEGNFQETPDAPALSPDEAVDLDQIGLVLVPDVLERTPPYVDQVRGDSPAAKAGLKADDLIVFLGQNLVHSCQGLRDELARIERETALKLVVMRGQELIEVEIPSPPPSEPNTP